MRLMFLLLFALAFTACKQEQKHVVEESEFEIPPALQTVHECFVMIRNNDTIAMSLVHQGDEVGGDLIYKLFEKDQNSGTLSGRFLGDTLIADYTFESEGTSSIREAIFLRKGSALIQGFGEMKAENGMEIFKDYRKVRFDGNIALMKTECN